LHPAASGSTVKHLAALFPFLFSESITRFGGVALRPHQNRWFPDDRQHPIKVSGATTQSLVKPLDDLSNAGKNYGRAEDL
jgi:hypothetical protein